MFRNRKGTHVIKKSGIGTNNRVMDVYILSEQLNFKEETGELLVDLSGSSMTQEEISCD